MLVARAWYGAIPLLSTRAQACHIASAPPAIARHFPLGGAKRSRSFAGLVLTAIEGAWIRGRAERSGKSFVEAGEWLARLV